MLINGTKLLSSAGNTRGLIEALCLAGRAAY